MTGTPTPEPLFVDTSVEYHAHRRIAGRNAAEVRNTGAVLALDAYERAARQGREPVQIEVIVRVAP